MTYFSPLKARYEFIEDVPVEYLELYREHKDGSWVIQVDGIKTQADVDSVMRALDYEKASHKKTKGKLSAYLDEQGALQDEIRSHSKTKKKLERLCSLAAQLSPKQKV